MSTKLRAGDVCYITDIDNDPPVGNFFYMLSSTTMVWLTVANYHECSSGSEGIQDISEWGTGWFSDVVVVFNIDDLVRVVKDGNGD